MRRRWTLPIVLSVALSTVSAPCYASCKEEIADQVAYTLEDLTELFALREYFSDRDLYPVADAPLLGAAEESPPEERHDLVQH